MRSKIIVIIYFILSLYIYFNRQGYKENNFGADPCGYYLYLPAIFIYHDLGKLAYLDSINSRYNFHREQYGLYQQPNNRFLDKYPIGTAILHLPLFLVAQLYCAVDKTYPDDGYSMPFGIAISITSLLLVVLGLLVLRKFLLQYYSDPAVSITLLCIALGTNLYTYSVFTPGYSHPGSFMLVAALLYCTSRFHSSFDRKYLLYLGFITGMLIVTRPVNVLITINPILWPIQGEISLKNKLMRIAEIRIQAVLAVLFLLVPIVIQMSYWKYTTGSWLTYSYKNEYFNFLKPHVFKGLFSWRRGWFLYSPIAGVSIIGLIFLWKKDRHITLIIAAFLVAFIYITFSWRQWFYGGGFSIRPLIDILPVLSLPLAAFITHILSIRQWAIKAGYLLVICFFIVLNMFQSYQFMLKILPYDNITRKQYFEVFGKTKRDNKSALNAEEVD